MLAPSLTKYMRSGELVWGSGGVKHAKTARDTWAGVLDTVL